MSRIGQTRSNGRKKLPVTDNPSIDRRIRRTRASLEEALMSLMPQTPYDEITVADVCAAANVGRSTFYAHYRSKDDLKRTGIDEHLRRQLEERRRAAVDASPTLVILEHVRDHGALCRGLVKNRGAAIALEAIEHTLEAMLRDELVGGAAAAHSFEREFRIRYLVGAFMAVLIFWLERGARQPVEEIERLFQQISPDVA